MFDLLITNGRIIDGTGQTWFRASLGITDDYVTVIKGDTSHLTAGRVIDAAGSIVCPGFIDMHSHSEIILMVELNYNILHHYHSDTTTTTTD